MDVILNITTLPELQYIEYKRTTAALDGIYQLIELRRPILNMSHAIL